MLNIKERGVLTVRNLDQILEEIKSMPGRSAWSDRRGLKELANALNSDEHVKALCTGVQNGRTTQVACTEKRVIFLEKGLVYSVKQIDMPIEKINSVGHQRGLVFGEIVIWDGASYTNIKNVEKKAAEFFVKTVQQQIEARKETIDNRVAESASVADELFKLKALWDTGILSQKEFETQKQKILNK